MTNKEAAEILELSFRLDCAGFPEKDKQEALQTAIDALHTLDKLEEWTEKWKTEWDWSRCRGNINLESYYLRLGKYEVFRDLLKALHGDMTFPEGGKAWRE